MKERNQSKLTSIKKKTNHHRETIQVRLGEER